MFLRGTAAAGGIALINAIGNIGGFVGPFLVGWIKETTRGYPLDMAAAAIAMTVFGRGLARGEKPFELF